MTLVRRLFPVLLMVLALCLAACGSEGDDDIVPDGSVTVDSGSSADASSAKKAFGAVCANAGECESGNCFNFNNRGLRCTKTCMVATAAVDCAPSTLGCNGMGVCKTQ